MRVNEMSSCYRMGGECNMKYIFRVLLFIARVEGLFKTAMNFSLFVYQNNDMLKHEVLLKFTWREARS